MSVVIDHGDCPWLSDCCEDKLCDEGWVCHDQWHGYCYERFPTVFWVFQFIFIGLFILQCCWAGCHCIKKTNKMSESQQSVQQTTTTTTSNNNQLILPQGWIELHTTDGKVYYQNNIIKKTQWKKPVMAQTTDPDPSDPNNFNENEGDNNGGCGFVAFLEFPFSTTCRNWLMRLLCVSSAITSTAFASAVPSCCPDFYDSSYFSQCCSWAATNPFILGFSFLLFAWYCLSGLYVVIVNEEEMTWISSNTSGNTQTTTISTSSNVSHNVCMFTCQAVILLFIMFFFPVVMVSNCQNYYC